MGSEDDEATLVTKSSTYRIRRAESSNCSLIIPKEQTNENIPPNSLEIHSSVTSYYELQKIPPKIEKLRDILHKSCYSPKNEGELIGFSFDELLNQIQASEEELKAALFKEKAFCLNERWQILAEDYERDVFSFILLSIQSNNPSFHDVRLRETYSSLKNEMMMDLPPLKIVRHLLTIYSQATKKEQADEIYDLDMTKVMIFYAQYILHLNHLKPMKSEDFMKKWNAQCPMNCRPQLSLLNGIVLEVVHGFQKYLEYFPANRLPSDIPTRFKILFEKQPKWTLSQIQPYLR